MKRRILLNLIFIALFAFFFILSFMIDFFFFIPIICFLPFSFKSSRFTRLDSERLETEQSSYKDLKIRYCPKCGGKIAEPIAEFCYHCGEKLE